MEKILSRRRPLQWRHNEHSGVSNHQPHDCLLNRLFRRRSKNTSKLRVTGLCAGNSPVTREFPAQRANNAENVSIWWRHHVAEIFAAVHLRTMLNQQSNWRRTATPWRSYNVMVMGLDFIHVKYVTLFDQWLNAPVIYTLRPRQNGRH